MQCNGEDDTSMISKYRSVLMGMATLGILGIHSIDYGVQYPGGSSQSSSHGAIWR